MLTAIREGSKGWISGIIIGLIVLTFALWGISSYLEGGDQAPVATVNGDEIDAVSYQNELSRQRQLLSSRFGSSLTPEMLESLGIQQRVLDSLIESRLLSQYTRDRNYRLSDDQLARRIRENELFQTDGAFDPARYEQLLLSNGMTPQGFELMERQNGINGQLAEAIADSAFVVDSELDRLVALQNQSREVQYAVIPGDLFVDEFEVAEEDIRAEYDDNIEAYNSPARMKVEYLDLSVGAIAADYSPTEDEIAQTYERIKGRLKTAEVRKASHILISVAGDADETTRAGARERAESILQQIRSGEDFAALAESNSDDPGSAAQGGDLGVVNRGQMVQPFEDAVFGMTEGEVVGPVETQFGFHVIKLTELEPEQQQTLEQAREEVIEEARNAAAEVQFNDLVEPFNNAIFEQPDTLAPAADATGLTVQVSDWFTRDDGEGIAAEPAVRAAAFGADVLDEGLNSSAVELGFDRLVAVRKLEFEEAAPRPFEDVREEILASLRLERSMEKAVQQAEAAISDLTHLASWDIMLAKNEWRAEVLPERRNQAPPRLQPLAQSVFTDPVPAEGSPVYGHAVLGNGDVAVYALTGVTPGDPDTVTDTELAGLRSQLEQRDGAELYRSFIGMLRQLAEIEVNQEQLEQL